MEMGCCAPPQHTYTHIARYSLLLVHTNCSVVNTLPSQNVTHRDAYINTQTGSDAFMHVNECVLTHTYTHRWMVQNISREKPSVTVPFMFSVYVCVRGLALHQPGSLYTQTNEPAHTLVVTHKAMSKRHRRTTVTTSLNAIMNVKASHTHTHTHTHTPHTRAS